jgi:hypothetical protein
MPVKAKKESSKIQFFGEVDLNDQGGIKSDMPAWYLERHIEEMEEGILRKETALQNRTVDPEVVPRMREEVKAERAKLKQIKEGKPDLNDTQRDKCAATYESLRGQIKDSMPTRKQAKDGLVDPYNEMKRLKSKHITISPEMAKACYQILGKTLGESTSVEELRKDGGHPAQESIHDLTKLILEGREVRGG